MFVLYTSSTSNKYMRNDGRPHDYLIMAILLVSYNVSATAQYNSVDIERNGVGDETGQCIGCATGYYIGSLGIL